MPERTAAYSERRTAAAIGRVRTKKGEDIMKSRTAHAEHPRERSRILAAVIAVLALLGTLLCGVLPAAAEGDTLVLTSCPAEEQFGSLKIGDLITFREINSQKKGDYSGYDIQVTAGPAKVEDAFDPIGKMYYRGIRMTGNGAVTAVVTLKGGGVNAQKTLHFTVSGTPDVKVESNFPKELHLKLGEEIGELCGYSARISGLNYGLIADAQLEVEGDIEFAAVEVTPSFSGVIGDDRVLEDRLGMRLDMYRAARVGTGYVYARNGGKTVGDPLCKVIVDAPTIKVNAPAVAKEGDTLRLETALEGTALKDLKTVDFDNKANYQNGVYKSDCPVVFKPSVTVVDGADCVKQSAQDYSSTLCSAETLTFVKSGFVTLKVSYTRYQTWRDLYNATDGGKYAIEKAVTIQINDKNGVAPTTTAKPAETTNGKATVKPTGAQTTAVTVAAAAPNEAHPSVPDATATAAAPAESDTPVLPQSTAEPSYDVLVREPKWPMVLGITAAAVVVIAGGAAAWWLLRRRAGKGR